MLLSALRRLLGASILSLLAIAPAWALKEIAVRESDTVVVPVSIRDQTRIKVSHGRIVDVFGDVFDESRNPAGRIAVIQDDDGDLFVKPVMQPALADGKPALGQPIKLDIKSTQGSFGLLLQPMDSPGQTVDVRIQGGTPRGAPEGPRLKNGSHVRTLKAFTLAMASPGAPDATPGLTVRDVGREVALWQEARFVHLRQHRGTGLVGDTYELTNISASRMVIDEREFFTEGVLAVSARRLILQPGHTTVVWIVRAAAGE